MNNPKYKKTIRNYDNPANRFQYTWKCLNRKNIEHIKSVLKSDRVELETSIANFIASKGSAYLSTDSTLRIYYDGELIFDYPNKCFGRECTVYDRYRKRYTSFIVGRGQDLGLLAYVQVYVNTPVSELDKLPSGPLGIYEILLAIDERVSLKKLEYASIMFQSFEARKVIEMRKLKKMEKKD